MLGIPGFMVSLIVSFVVFGDATGVLWIYVLGDNPWPSSIGAILSVLFVLGLLTVWIASVTIGFVTGRKLETIPGFNKKHIFVSIVATIAPFLFIVLHQVNVGNIGPKTDGLRCSDFCSQMGYSASGIPSRNSGERSCSCYDNSGIEVMKVPIDSIATDKQTFSP